MLQGDDEVHRLEPRDSVLQKDITHKNRPNNNCLVKKKNAVDACTWSSFSRINENAQKLPRFIKLQYVTFF